LHGSTENERGQGQFMNAQPQPQPFNLGIDDQGNLVMAMGGQVVSFTPADALKIAGTICGLMAQRMAQAPSKSNIVIAGALPHIPDFRGN